MAREDDKGGRMLYWANEVAVTLGLAETIILIFALLLLGVYLVRNRLEQPPGRFFRLGIWLPLFLGVNAAFGGWRDARKTYFYLQQADAINEAQRDLLFTEAYRGAIRIILVGTACSLILWRVVRHGKNGTAKRTTKSR